jgi:hypothetical protein
LFATELNKTKSSSFFMQKKAGPKARNLHGQSTALQSHASAQRPHSTVYIVITWKRVSKV